MKETFNVRDAHDGDLNTLIRFNAALAWETEGRRLDPDVVGRGVAAALAHSDYGFYLVAERPNGAPVGCLLVTREWSDWRNAFFWWIQSLYVIPELRRCGVFRAMSATLAERVRSAANVCGFRLYVERGNDAARNAYARLGFRDSGYLMLEKSGGTDPNK